jgi:PAS domain S-box-containing protein
MKEKLKADLRESGGIWEEILDSLPAYLTVVDNDGKLVYMNEYGEKLYNVSKDQYLGEHCLVNAENFMSQRMHGLVENLLERGEYYKTVSKLELKDDQLYTTVSIGIPLKSKNGYVLVGIPSKEISADQKELRRLTSKIQKYGKFLESLIESSPNAIFATNNNDEIELTNKKGEILFGYSSEELSGASVSSMFKDQSEFTALKSVSPEERQTEIHCVDKEGNSFPVRLQFNDIEDEKGRVQGTLYIVTDMTREKAMEAKLALSEKLAIYSEMMAGIFHQINNPLVGVVNFSSVLLEKMSPDDSNRNLVSTIFDAGKKCQKLIATMMKCIREPQATFGKVDIAEVLASTIQEAMKEESERAEQVTIKTGFAQDYAPVRGDALQLHQVFRNLIINALQAMPGGGMLEVATSLDASENSLVVSVSDTGEGISQENLEKVFTPFFSTKRYTGGGLGLSFAYQVIKAHAGSIEVDSEVGKGATFRVSLPIVV